MSKIKQERALVMIANYHDNIGDNFRDNLDTTLSTEIDESLKNWIYENACFYDIWLGTYTWEQLTEEAANGCV